MLEIALRFTFKTIAHIHRQVRECPGEEVGGLLFASEAELVADQAVENVAPDRSSAFEIQPEMLSAAIRVWHGFELIGTYHSHPNGNAQMSSADAAMATSTGMLLVVAPGSPWQWRLWDPVAGGEVGFAIEPPRA